MEQKIDRKKEKKQNVICICGMTGCGKSTLAKQLANKYELKYFSGGDTL
ncbi:AAA family ATPase, partial [Candidatus Bathyarchaeota archaeon]|nr:AAA family ATPase [Candidatus Bathyarchaeota archaeon]